jgi:uncharacterized membrane protein YgcG
MKLISLNKSLSNAVSSSLALVMVACSLLAAPAWAQDQSQEAPPPPAQDQPQQQAPLPPAQGGPQTAPPLSPEQLQQLVAPIALYPDALVAQILAASAYPTQIVEAERFLEANPNLKGKDLGSAVDQQDWDPSVKALVQFPSVLANLNKNLSWTSELGDANLNQEADVMRAIQFMRKKAQAAGHLQTTPQQTVTDQGPDVDIAPADPDEVYVPDYDPELIYGYPVGLWPGFDPWWGVGGPYLSFGVGFGIGPFFGFGWGWGGWGLDWGGGYLRYGGGRYGFHSHAFYDRNAYFHGNYRGFAPYGRGDRGARGFAGAGGRGSEARGGHGAGAGGGRGVGGAGARGFSGSRGYSGTRSGAFSGMTRGGDARGFSSRGRSSFGGGSHGGGGMRGGGGGGHGGGGRR